ncbi:hypothetical protein LCGC14_1741550 [marine sediment metagenome]|uniref:Polysaccharide pyruvyl transferase domain-containing protein n=1 Tax=marine sediment metagenome TaxID=412755 RepID=A0A0F9HU50_9ZZZZ
MITLLGWGICRARYNAGDWVGPYLFEKMTGIKPRHVTPAMTKQPYILSCGSILQNAKSNSIVWGSGLISYAKVPKNITVLAVRGPLTRNALIKQGIKCPAVYGDPGLLLPRFYSPQIEKKYKVGIIPHYIEHNLIKSYFAAIPNVLIIDINRPIEKVLNDIISCKSTISTSLHGIIFSHAYDVPCMWARYPNTKVIGGNFKFHDYYMSRGMSQFSPRIVTILPKNSDRLYEEINKYPQPHAVYDCDILLKVCPFGKSLAQIK